jgi:3-hydroxyacyl-[acyl-carrier-protein] dehydratase
MRYSLIDEVVEVDSERIVAVKNVTAAEEYLADHFPGFPVLPGVFMLEAMVQAARRLLRDAGRPRMVLGGVRALRYASLVRPGEALKVEVSVDGDMSGDSVRFRGTGSVMRIDGGSETAVTGRFTMRDRIDRGTATESRS